MYTSIITPVKKTKINPDKLLSISAMSWFVIATAGQWIFGIYVLLFYHGYALSGDFEKWNKVLPSGYIKGDLLGNISVAVHVLLGGIIVIGGPLQFVPFIQRKFRTFHRWLGRFFVITSMIIGVAGLIMVWVRGAIGDTFMHISISISAVYLFAFAFLTIKSARNKKFKEHRQWALRLFMIANGGWFFRIGVLGWILVNGGPVGFNVKTFSGPALWAISAMSYSLPIALLILELYLYAQRQKKQLVSVIAASIIFIATVLTFFGVVAATVISWYPRMFL